MLQNVSSAQPTLTGLNVKSMSTERINTLQNSMLKKIATAVNNNETQSMSHQNHNSGGGHSRS